MAMPTATSERSGSVINQRFSAPLPPLVGQLMNMLGMKTAGRSIARGREIVSEGRPCSSVFLIAEGVAIRYRILRDGQRQIVSLLLPGDFAGVSSCRFETALFSIKTLTHSVIHPIPLPRLATLIDSQPQLAAQLFWSFANDTIVVAERLIAIGRCTALERVAHFLLELLVRMRRLGLAQGNIFRLPLTQEIIGDAVGLSIPYVNRVLHQLQYEDLVRVRKGQFEIRNVEELSAIADFKHEYLQPQSILERIAVH